MPKKPPTDIEKVLAAASVTMALDRHKLLSTTARDAHLRYARRLWPQAIRDEIRKLTKQVKYLRSHLPGGRKNHDHN
ncbi:hypothetical protein BA190_09220 [Labrys sp. WJW]|uniref:hypothetical protein n=1 Tax=Labrys sp. WJW TaxID=1737983 RepID=UPI000831A88B|nr:hypothetical protein [Labrys sp. WJW]OCC05085.1 hypothetical protein BA190_09220 [Labrys sp. WJW]